MALDPTKKKDPLNPTANLPAGVQAGMAAVKPQGTQIGNLTLIPGSGLDNAVKAIGQHQAGVTNTLAAADRLNATRPQFITPNAGQIPDKAFKAPLGAAPQSGIKPVIIDPANAASMQLTPPSKADVYPARNPAVPASSAGATAPGGGVPAPSPKPVSVNLGSSAQYGGGGVVRDSLASSVTNGVPTYDNASITRLNARNAATNPTAATSPLGSAPAPFAPPVAQPNLAVPSLDLPSVNTLRTSDAERERAALAKNIDDQLRDMNFAGLNSRGKRELYANLLRERSGLAENGGNLAGTAAQAQLDAATRAGTATQSQVGENARAQLGEQGANQRASLGTAADLFKANLDASKVGQMDANGNLLTTLGTPITGADGKPVRGAQTKADGAITPAVQLDSLTKRYTALLGQPPIDPAQAPQYEAQKAALAQQIEALSNAGAGGQGQAASGVPAGYTLVGTKDGKRIFKDANGKTYSE